MSKQTVHFGSVATGGLSLFPLHIMTSANSNSSATWSIQYNNSPMLRSKTNKLEKKIGLKETLIEGIMVGQVILQD